MQMMWLFPLHYPAFNMFLYSYLKNHVLETIFGRTSESSSSDLRNTGGPDHRCASLTSVQCPRQWLGIFALQQILGVDWVATGQWFNMKYKASFKMPFPPLLSLEITLSTLTLLSIKACIRTYHSFFSKTLKNILYLYCTSQQWFSCLSTLNPKSFLGLNKEETSPVNFV